MKVDQFREYVVRPVLRFLEPEIPYSEAAENLLVGTALQESRLCYLDQLDKAGRPGPAFGLFQMERATHDDHWRWIEARPELARKIKLLMADHPTDRMEQLRSNLAYATAMARVHYRRRTFPLPTNAGDIAALARIYKAHYNTPLGKATAAQFVKNYRGAGQ
ncbi:hypothetical protein K2Z84_05405 [Candidatus Binatia bacterium]|nr:hypothetical protein [Candidatus Binatia bacterium]